jgi:hypothetical protein
MFVMNVHLDDLNTEDYYFPVPVTARLVKAVSTVVDAAVAATGCTLTLSDGTNTVGTITIAASAAEGDCDSLVLDTTTKGAVKFDATTDLKISAAASATGQANVALVFDEFHAAN